MPSLNRVVMNRTSVKWLTTLDLANMNVAEISGHWGQRLKDAGSYRRFRYPRYDICKGPFKDSQKQPLTYDLILANQIWEHLDRPFLATCHVHDMLSEGGYFWLAVPFYIPFHAAPVDCSRWSARGLSNLLVEAGFKPENIRAAQWGNRAAALRNMEADWPPEYRSGEDDLENDENFPICAWAMARKT